jgi:hypothetical protein
MNRKLLQQTSQANNEESSSNAWTGSSCKLIQFSGYLLAGIEMIWRTDYERI